MQVLYSDEFGSIIHYPGYRALELNWSEATENITDDAFKMWLTKFGELAIEVGSHYLIIDGVNFRGKSSPELVGSWREEHVIPLYNQAKTKKLGFLYKELSPEMKAKAPEVHGVATYPTGYFDSRESLYGWFGEGNTARPRFDYCAIRSNIADGKNFLKFFSDGKATPINDVHGTMAELGGDGWELVSLQQISKPDARVYYFKRQLT